MFYSLFDPQTKSAEQKVRSTSPLSHDNLSHETCPWLSALKRKVSRNIQKYSISGTSVFKIATIKYYSDKRNLNSLKMV